jgi:hypothetical protein
VILFDAGRWWGQPLPRSREIRFANFGTIRTGIGCAEVAEETDDWLAMQSFFVVLGAPADAVEKEWEEKKKNEGERKNAGKVLESSRRAALARPPKTNSPTRDIDDRDEFGRKPRHAFRFGETLLAVERLLVNHGIVSGVSTAEVVAVIRVRSLSRSHRGHYWSRPRLGERRSPWFFPPIPPIPPSSNHGDTIAWLRGTVCRSRLLFLPIGLAIEDRCKSKK